MRNTKNALELRSRLMAVIDQCRAETGDCELGVNIERAIIEEDLRELDAEIMEDPGALESQMVLVKRRRV